jgi:hypothetical protein
MRLESEFSVSEDPTYSAEGPATFPILVGRVVQAVREDS